MLPIELFGWILSVLLTISFVFSLVFISKKPALLSKSDYHSLQKNPQHISRKGKRFC